MSLDDFTRMVMEYFANPKMRVPRAMTAHFLESPETDEEKKIAEVNSSRASTDGRPTYSSRRESRLKTSKSLSI
ncbi:hypothetical protein [Ralstonia pickettii]|uniref:hypothetical protein n=1 Tax=Ralstonia pickettii TaxID=329 RepID=UPI001F3D4270|nr:hypothetical protein [Ralstonia pickettii]